MYIPRGVQEVSNILSKSTNFLVYYDPDIDGLIAGSFVTKFLTDFGKPNIYYINENRAHGFKLPLESLDDYKGYTIIAVDFAIPVEILKAIVDRGLNIINIDHHHTEQTELFTYENNECSAVLVNNQYCFEPEDQRFQSGAGMVWHTLNAMFPDYMNTQRNRALVGLSLLSDIREIENNNAAAFLTDLYSWSDDYSEYLITLTQGEHNYSFGVQRHLDRNYIDYSFSPKFNALFRLNLGDTAIQLFNGLPVEVDLNLMRAKQKEIEATIEANLRNHSINGLTIMSIDISTCAGVNWNITNFIGLVCGHMKDSTGQTAFLYVSDGDKVLRGSVRGKYDAVDYRAIFEKYGLTAAGHSGAFGVYCDSIASIDFNALANEISEYEMVQASIEANNTRFIKVANLRVATANDTRVPIYNNYVRDAKRIMYDCSECRYVTTYESKTKNYLQYSIDGVSVKCFDKTLTPEEGYVLPLMNNGYIEYYLKRSV